MNKNITFILLVSSIICGYGQSTELKNATDSAAYAYGLNQYRNIESAKNSSFFKDEALDIDELIKGMEDYFKNQSPKKLSYVYGEHIASSVEAMESSQSINFDYQLVIKAIIDASNNKSLLISKDDASNVLRTFQTKQLDIRKAENLEKSRLFIEEIASQPGVQKTESGLLYKVLKEGTGKKPKDEDVIKAYYTGKFMDGTVFDSTEKNNNFPIKNKVNQFIDGFTEGLKLMPIGSKYIFYIPADLAYGEKGQPRGGIGPNEALIFEVELLEIVPETTKS